MIIFFFFFFLRNSGSDHFCLSSFIFGTVWIGIIAFAFCVFLFFFSSCVSAFLGDKNYYLCIVHNTIQALKNIKNGFYGTIYTFNNYFAIVFSIFSFSKNKLYPNGPLSLCSGKFTLFDTVSPSILNFC